MIGGGKLHPVLRGAVKVLHLCGHGQHAALVQRGYIRLGGPDPDATASTVIADAIDVRFIDADRAVIHVVDDIDVHIGDRTVVVKDATIPAAAPIAAAIVAVTVINAAVEADVRTPVAAMEAVISIPPSPIAGSP